jgi:hypothetical protein
MRTSDYAVSRRFDSITFNSSDIRAFHVSGLEPSNKLNEVSLFTENAREAQDEGKKVNNFHLRVMDIAAGNLSADELRYLLFH